MIEPWLVLLFSYCNLVKEPVFNFSNILSFFSCSSSFFIQHLQLIPKLCSLLDSLYPSFIINQPCVCWANTRAQHGVTGEKADGGDGWASGVEAWVASELCPPRTVSASCQHRCHHQVPFLLEQWPRPRQLLHLSAYFFHVNLTFEHHEHET